MQMPKIELLKSATLGAVAGTASLSLPLCGRAGSFRTARLAKAEEKDTNKMGFFMKHRIQPST